MVEMDDTLTSPDESDFASSEQRSSSPSPSVSPSLALDAVPLLDRSASTPSTSSISTLSTRSRQSRMSDGGAAVVKRRGYMRPQGTAFADSARNRDSVMSLGSIAHMQYYFARTGLLDGKGGQLAKEREKKKFTSGKENVEPSGADLDDWGISSFCLNDSTSNYAVSDSGLDPSVVESPSDLTENAEFFNNESFFIPMLPPTVSTYKQKPSYTEPLPDMPVLRRELKEALQDACKVLEESQKHDINGQSVEESSGFYEIQGLHLLDIITLAIRAAKNYYTAHTNPQKLYAIKSERMIRADLYKVLDVLKRMASRNFRGGMRMSELTDLILWIESIDKMVKKEEEQEQQETAERESWVWREGDWTGREREREALFLSSFDLDKSSLPTWPEHSTDQTLPNDFLLALQDGQRLVKLHNALVNRSKRKFGEIKTWHTDVGKPYRMAENLRFWMKASELRWEIKLNVPVLDVVNSKGDEAWKKFDEAIFIWSQSIRSELTEEWRQEALNQRRKPPELKVDLSDANGELENDTIEELPLMKEDMMEDSGEDQAAVDVKEEAIQPIKATYVQSPAAEEASVSEASLEAVRALDEKPVEHIEATEATAPPTESTAESKDSSVETAAPTSVIVDVALPTITKLTHEADKTPAAGDDNDGVAQTDSLVDAAQSSTDKPIESDGSAMHLPLETAV